jgi:hypothetical protein
MPTASHRFRGVLLPAAIVGGLYIAAAAALDATPASVTSDIRISPTTLTVAPVSTTPIYVELDWMEDATHSHKPSQSVIDTIVATFAREGFNINIVVSNAVPHQTPLAITGNPSSSPSVQAIKAAYFNNAGDSRYFYSLWAHNYSLGGQTTSSSGYADLPGSTHLVTLGSFSNQVGTFSNQVGTFIHEFGHNIGQYHGGIDSGNYKPNYISVMNYHYQLNGLGPSLVALQFANTTSGFNTYGYSHGLLPSLNEANLNETLGIGLGRARDWNCDGILSTSIARDIQESNPCAGVGAQSVLSDFDNWGAINAFVRTGAIPMRPGTEVSEICITPEEDLPLKTAIDALRAKGDLPEEEAFIVSTAGRDPLGAAASSFTVFNDGNTTLNVTGITLDTPASWITWEPQSFTVPPGGSQRVHVYVNFATKPSAYSSRRLLIASDDPDESPYPGGVFITLPGAPDSFSRIGPVDASTRQLTSPTLTWSESLGATGYQYCYDTIDNGACDSSWVSAGMNTSVALNGLLAGTRYFWHVRATNSYGTTYTTGNPTAYWSFTTGVTRPPLVYLDAGESADVFFHNPSTGAWSRQISQPGGGFVQQNQGTWAPGWAVQRADFNADAFTDFFLFNTTTGAWSKVLNDGTVFSTQSTGGWWPGWERYVMDLDGDGISDIFLYDPATGVWFKCISTPTGFTYVQGGWNPGWELYPMRLNNDALGDLFLFSRTTGRWFCVLGAAGAGFTYPSTETWFPGWQFYPGDFNGDGLTDILLHDPPTGVYFVAMKTAGGFTFTQGGWSVGWTPHVADFNGDGKDDLFLHAQATGVWFEMISNGAGGFASAGGQIWSLGWTLSVTDLNGDARADIVLFHPGTGVWYQARNLVNGTFSYNSGTWPPGLTIVARSPIR